MWSATVDVVGGGGRRAGRGLRRSSECDADAEIRSFALASLVRVDLFAGNGFDRQAAQRALELEARCSAGSG